MNVHATAMGSPAGSCPLMANYGAPEVMFVRGRGTELYDREGRRYLDLLCGLAVTSLGHAHPAVTAAVAEQARRLTHVSNLFANEHQEAVARTLDRLVRHGDPEALPGQVLFQNSGAEANEAALKLARRHQGRGRHVVVSALRSFHGRTLATLAATGQPEKHEPFQPLPEGFRHVPFDDAAALEAALGPEVGAVLLESVQGEGGVNPARDAYLREVRRLCDDRGILLILDEIQTGLARTGTWFGFQHAGIRPDIVTMAKALGNGVPVGAVWARADVAAAFRPGDHGSTFAGQPLALAAARAVLETMIELDAPSLVRERGEVLRSRLADLPGVVDVRGRGLLLAAEIDPATLGDRTAAGVARSALVAARDGRGPGVIVNGVTPTALRFAPPFCVTDDEIDTALGVVARTLGSAR